MANNIYIGNRYVPVFANPVEWDNLREYEPLTIVTYQGTSYTSKKTVPVGIGLDNKDYWVVTGNYNQQVEAYRQETNEVKELVETFKAEQESLNTSLDGRITTLEDDNELTKETLINIKNKVFLGNKPSVITVAKSGGMFDTINKAINYAKGYCTPTNRVTIVVYSGVYEEEIYLKTNPGIDFVGVGEPKVQYNSTYPYAPLCMMGTGRVEGFYFVNTNSNGNAYAFHYEGQEDGSIKNAECHIKNCNFVSAGNAPVGCGMGPGHTLRFYNCNFYASDTAPAVYFHNYPMGDDGLQTIECINCNILTKNSFSILIDNARSMQGRSKLSPLALSFTNCCANSGSYRIKYRTENDVSSGYIPKTGEVFIKTTSVGNTNMNGVDYEKSYIGLNGLITLPYWGDDSGNTVRSFSLPSTLPLEQYDCELYQCIINTTDFKSVCTIDNAANGFINCHINNESVGGRTANIGVSLTPKP